HHRFFNEGYCLQVLLNRMNRQGRQSTAYHLAMFLIKQAVDIITRNERLLPRDDYPEVGTRKIIAFYRNKTHQHHQAAQTDQPGCNEENPLPPYILQAFKHGLTIPL